MKTTLTSSEKMNATLWVAQAALATVYTILGMIKILLPVEVSNGLLPLIGHPRIILIRVNGLFEVFGAIGLLVPPLLEYKSNICSWAATGLAIMALSAIPYYIWMEQWNTVAINLIFGTVAIFIAWGRFKVIPFRKTFLLNHLPKT